MLPHPITIKEDLLLPTNVHVFASKATVLMKELQ